MRAPPRLARWATIALGLLCLMLVESSCQRRPVPRSSEAPAQPSDGNTAAHSAEEEEEARQRVDEESRALDTKGLDSAYAPTEAVRVASEAVKLDPHYAPAYRLLGRGLLEQAAFVEAAAAFQRSLELQPHHPQAEKGLREAERLTGLAQSLSALLKPEQRLRAMVETRQDSRPCVFALVGTRKRYEHYSWYVHAEARLFVSDRGRYRETFQTTHVAWEGDEEIGYYRVWVADLLGMGRQQIILVSGRSGADHVCEALDVFLPQGVSLRHIVHADGLVPGGNASFEVTDLDGDGRREIKAYKMLEFLFATCAMWCDVLQYDGRRYGLATRRFPDIVRENVAELESWREFCRDQGMVEGEQARKYLALGRRYLAGLEEPSPTKQ